MKRENYGEGMEIKTAYELIDLPKAMGRPPRASKTLKTFCTASIRECFRYFNTQKIKPIKGSKLHKIYLSQEGGIDFLYLVEEPLHGSAH